MAREWAQSKIIEDEQVILVQLVELLLKRTVKTCMSYLLLEAVEVDIGCRDAKHTSLITLRTCKIRLSHASKTCDKQILTSAYEVAVCDL